MLYNNNNNFSSQSDTMTYHRRCTLTGTIVEKKLYSLVFIPHFYISNLVSGPDLKIFH